VPHSNRIPVAFQDNPHLFAPPSALFTCLATKSIMVGSDIIGGLISKVTPGNFFSVCSKMNGMSSRRCEPGTRKKAYPKMWWRRVGRACGWRQDERFAEFHETRFDEVVAELFTDLVDEFDHDLVAFLEP